MAGIYIHIPFCKKACNYCNFHFSTNLKVKPELIESIKKELILNAAYLQNQNIETIYLGGGTPSLLSATEIKEVLYTIDSHYNAKSVKEITLEANPDDLSKSYLSSIFEETSINRLSIGVQSFHEKDLRWMNRAHSANQANECIEDALSSGFKHLSIDLIYGLPASTPTDWLYNLKKLSEFDIEHASCYALTVEGNTALHHAIENKKVPPIKDELMVRDFNLLMEYMEMHEFEHYEISNFARGGTYAQHNSNYWLGAWYLGVGPSAHSYNGTSRQWNVANNNLYIKSMSEDILPFIKEELTQANRYNEYVMTRLRTRWGCSEIEIESSFGEKILDHFNTKMIPFISNNWVKNELGLFSLTNNGKLHADLIASTLFL